jgi:predicted amidophosphoribosyltransferase
VRGSFRARPGALAGRRALLLDDVTTTGATLAEAGRTLRAAARPRSLTPLALAGTPAL